MDQAELRNRIDNFIDAVAQEGSVLAAIGDVVQVGPAETK